MSRVDLGRLPQVFGESPHGRALIVLARLEARQHAFSVVEVPSGAILAIDGWYQSHQAVPAVDAREVAAETGRQEAVHQAATLWWLSGPLGEELGPSLAPDRLATSLLASWEQPRRMPHVHEAIVGAYIPLT